MWFVGVILELISTASGTVGKQLIRYSELQKLKGNVARGKFLLSIGLVVNAACGPIIDMAAYAFAPQSLIAPFGGMDIVWNTLLAPYTLGEKLTVSRIFGCILILFGTVVTAIFGSHEDKEFSIAYLEETLISFRVLIYFCTLFVWIALNISFPMRRPTGDTIRGLSLGMTAGSIAGNMFCVKATVEIVEFSIRNETGEPWTHWLPYVCLAGAIFFALSNVVFLTKGMQEYEALFMVALFEGSMIVSGCISGSIVLLELKDLEDYQIAMYIVGVFGVVCGLVWLVRGEMKSKSSLKSGNASLNEEAIQKFKSDHNMTQYRKSDITIGTMSPENKLTKSAQFSSPVSSRTAEDDLPRRSASAPANLSMAPEEIATAKDAKNQISKMEDIMVEVHPSNEGKDVDAPVAEKPPDNRPISVNPV